MMRISAILLILICMASASARKERSTHGRLAPKAAIEAALPVDTLAADSATVAISGFEKTLRSRWETFFVTNHSSRCIASITVDIEYLDTKGRQLHRRPGIGITFPEPIPPGETRQAKIATWDSQSVRYYHLSPPARTRAQATPFMVRITPKTITSPR